MEDLERFATLVKKWTKKINLISVGSADAMWTRHILDSAQIYHVAPKGDWLDLGSGGGFPGIVASIIAKHKGDTRKFTLVDSDQRKCVFLRAASRELDLHATVISGRIESLPAINSPVLSARALADLTALIGYAELHLNPKGVALFMKGKNWLAEHKDAQLVWSYDLEEITSKTDPSAIILKIKDIRRA